MDRNDRALTAFAMLGHATFHAYELVLPIFVVVWLDSFSTTATLLGAIVGGSYALTGIGALPSGILADRVSSRRLIVACLVGMGTAFLLVSVAPTLPVLAFALFVWGASASIYHPAGLALLSRGARERGTAFAYHGVAGNVGVATGPLLATILLVGFDWRIVTALLVVPVLVAIVIGIRLEFDETAGSAHRGVNASVDDRGRARRFEAFIADSKGLFTGGFVLVFVIGILFGMYYRGAFTFLPGILAGLELFPPVTIFDRSFEPSQYVYSALLLVGGFGQYAGGKLVDRIRIEYVLLGGYLALIAVALGFIPSARAGVIPLLGVAGLLGFVVFMLGPINQEAISKYSAADVRGLSFGYTYTAIFGIGAFGASLAGFVLTRFDPAALFVVIAGFAAVAVVICGYLLRCSEGPVQQDEDRAAG